MRILLVLCLLCAPAAAEVRDLQPWSFGIAADLHASKVSGLDERGYGPHAELAYGHRAMQYFLEGSVTYAKLAQDETLGGGRWRAAVGARWFPLSYGMERASVDFAVEAFAGVQRFEWDDGGEFERPEAGFGVGWQHRSFRDRHGRNQVMVRTMLRATFSTVERESVSAVCRGSCVMPMESGNTGISAVIGAQW